MRVVALALSVLLSVLIASLAAVSLVRFCLAVPADFARPTPLREPARITRGS
jgi:hypothetical protein